MFRGSIVALVTPFRNGAFDEDAFEDLIEWHLAEGTDGFVPVGTTGESPTLSHAEHERVIELCIARVAGRAPVIAGTGSNSTDEAISLTRHAKECGADAALVVTPYYNKPTQEGLFRHFQAIHDAVDIPLIIYNIPGRSVIDMTVDTMARLAELPRIAGVKDATGDMMRPLWTAERCGPDFCQLTGEDATNLAFLAHGGHGSISVTANVAPGLCARMQDAWAAGRPGEALEIHRRLAPLHRALFCETSPAPVKYALSRLGRCENSLRLPMVELTPAGRAQVDAALVAAGLID
ncbi:4-hydroxy-tetrahydrodipicolinate synthase [Geminicoccaceae bacterium 1502E]|nr:4-hydroxy-tetrahydrodipicolinate synthase [Geminicoccaceae bacterium 1502E]